MYYLICLYPSSLCPLSLLLCPLSLPRLTASGPPAAHPQEQQWTDSEGERLRGCEVEQVGHTAGFSTLQDRNHRERQQRLRECGGQDDFPLAEWQCTTAGHLAHSSGGSSGRGVHSPGRRPEGSAQIVCKITTDHPPAYKLEYLTPDSPLLRTL